MNGFAAQYASDGLALDGSGKKMRDDPRVIFFDDFSDYNERKLSDHVKDSGDTAPKRWMGGQGLSLDYNEKYSGQCSLKITVPQQESAFGAFLSQWVDARANRSEPMNGEPMTAVGYNVPAMPPGGMPLEPGVKMFENGLESIYARAMVKYAPGFNRYGHNGIHFSGGYSSRPNCNAGGGENNPGSCAGYRSNGFDRFIAGLEPEYTRHINAQRPGAMNVYYYGAEQLGASGNHMFPNGLVYGSTGGDGDYSLSRKNGENGFTAHPANPVPVGEWFCLEFFIKLNTVLKNGAPPGPNEMPVWTPTKGPQAVPPGCEILRDGVLKAWMNGEPFLDYHDVVFRYTDTMVIDLVAFSAFFHDNSAAESAIWYDNIVAATEYIGTVNGK